jgi:hypothetical protein
MFIVLTKYFNTRQKIPIDIRVSLKKIGRLSYDYDAFDD